jgi:cyclopropane-fatty-acyl-phospholipid synthase
MLDRHMVYSCGYYLTGDEDLDRAQIQKMDKIAAICGMKEGHRVLDIGCGWGGPLILLASRHGCAATGLTLSDVQRRWVESAVKGRELQDRVEIHVSDAHETDLPRESFDHVILLESIIHIADKARLFDRCRELLRPGGMVLVQESCYDRSSREERYRGDRGFQEVDRAFGYSGALVSGGEMLRLLEEAGLLPVFCENISTHYQRTLSQWAENLDRNRDEMERLAPEFLPLLRRYLMLALTSYRSGRTVCHMLAAQKPPQRWTRNILG